MTTEALPSAALYCREGGSDKEYHVKIEAKDDGFVVNYAYGRRGATLQPGTKTPKPVSREQAQRAYDKLVTEKQAKGYTATGETNADYVSASGQARAENAVALQLLEPIGEDQGEQYITNDKWIAQPKYDGKRILLKLAGGVVAAQNRKGLNCGFPKVFDPAIRKLGSTDIVLDGEAVGECFYAFDLVRLDGQDLRSQPYNSRWNTLFRLFPKGNGAVRLADTAYTTTEKRELYARLKEQRAEGIVFKNTASEYVGRRTAAQVKLKFWKEAQVIVFARNDTGETLDVPITYKKRRSKPLKRSIQAALLRGKELVFVGDVSVPVNYEMPTPGALAQIRYLYAFVDTDIMFQPQYEGERDDVKLEDCVLGQLRYKGEETEG